MDAKRVENVPCPYCGSVRYSFWAAELGFTAVRCQECRLLFCNPRPVAALIDSAVRTGAHGEEADGLVVSARRIDGKVSAYRALLGRMFDDVWRRGEQIRWLDVGAGYGEILEAVVSLAPSGSEVVGLEPMHPKAVKARERGLTIVEDYLRPGQHSADVVSIVDVFSHIPDFGAFLQDIRSALRSGGELFLETGNLADVDARSEFPGELGLPDHLVFAGETHIKGYLERAGFEIVAIERQRIDSWENLLKNLGKCLLRRPYALAIPYRSNYRQLRIRARLI
jgi:SAM-dependent methyltransferase